MVFRTILTCLGKAGYKRKGEAKTQWKKPKTNGRQGKLGAQHFYYSKYYPGFQFSI